MAITVPVVNTPLSVSTFGRPVADQLNALAQTAWTDLALTAPWVNIGAGRSNTGYCKVSGFTVVRLAVKSGVSGVVFATLPAGFRPPFYLDVLIRAGAGMGFWNIDTTGQMNVFLATGGDNGHVAGITVFPSV